MRRRHEKDLARGGNDLSPRGPLGHTFLLLTFGIPLLMVIAGAIPIVTELRGALPRVGYVDETGQLARVDSVAVGDETLDVVGYPDVDAAGVAFSDGDVGGYLVIPEDYFEGADRLTTARRAPTPGCRAA